jgi:glutamate dehydrogenase
MRTGTSRSWATGNTACAAQGRQRIARARGGDRLGILRPGHKHPAEHRPGALPSDIGAVKSRSRDLALVTKANFQSTVHRPGYIDYVGIKHFDPTGRLIGERRFLGLWTSAAYSSQSARNSAGAPQGRAGGAALRAGAGQPRRQGAAAHPRVLPRDELFQASVPELIRVAGIFGLQERPRVRLLLRRDAFRRFYSCLVFVPREKYNTQVRQRIEKVVGEAFNAFSMESQVQIAESNLARIHIVARTSRGARARRHAMRWSCASPRRCGPGRTASRRPARALRRGLRAAAVRTYAQAFPAAYTEDFSGDAAASTCRSSRPSTRNPSAASGHLPARPRRKERNSS